MRRIRNRLTYANVMSTLAVVLALGGGVAYAANTVFSEDIVNGEVKTADIGTNEVRSADVRDDTLAGGGLTGADIANAAGGSDDVDANLLDGVDSRGLVKGRGRLLGARFIMQPGQPDRTLFAIPDLGRLDAHCEQTEGQISMSNTTNSDLDWWDETEGFWYTGVLHPFGALSVVSTYEHGSTVTVGFGDDPGARRTATLEAFAKQVGGEGGPCIFQAQATNWTAG